MFLQAGLEDFCRCKPNLVNDFLHAGQCCLDFPFRLSNECFGAMAGSGWKTSSITSGMIRMTSKKYKGPTKIQ